MRSTALITTTLVLFSATIICCSPTGKEHHVVKRETCRELYTATQFCNNNGNCNPSTLRPDVEHVLCYCDKAIWQGGGCQFYMTASCSDSPCLNGATCDPRVQNNPDEKGFRCICPAGYTGTYCDVTQQSICADPERNPCQKQLWDKNISKNRWMMTGICHPGNSDSTYWCECFPKMSGQTCSVTEQCDPTRCKNGGTCTNSGIADSWECECADGFVGETCDKRVDAGACASNPCRNQGTCRDVEAGYECTCAADFAGERCETMIENNPCLFNPCRNGGTCMRNGNNYICMCAPGYAGDNCNGIGQFDACNPDNPCQNGGTCTNTLNSDGEPTYFCTCPPGYSGQQCTITDPCVTSVTCQNGGTCVSLGLNAFRCNCRAGFTGIDCSTPILDPCNPQPCQRGGTCLPAEGNSYICNCPQGYTGVNCQTPTTCSQNPCLNGAQCYDAYTSLGYMCRCSPNYLGTNCESRDPCASSPCGAGQQCISNSDDNSYSCLCTCGGDQELEPCLSNPCQNGASCTNTAAGSYFCTCLQNFIGRNCETYLPDPCSSNPCRYGTCTRSSSSSYVCTCQQNYIGRNCDTYFPVTCPDNYCMNGGTCVASESTRRLECTCPPGFFGTNCQYNIDPCSSSPCSNGGTCSFNMAGQYFCNCPDGFTGPRCEQIPDTCHNHACQNGATCIPAPRTGMAYACLCRPGWIDQYCNQPDQDPGGPRDPEPGCPNDPPNAKGCLYILGQTDMCANRGSCQKEEGRRDAVCCCDRYYILRDNTCVYDPDEYQRMKNLG